MGLLIHGQDILFSSPGSPTLNGDITKIYENDFYEIYRDKKAGQIIIYPIDYHPDNLIFTIEGLEKLLASLKEGKNSR